MLGPFLSRDLLYIHAFWVIMSLRAIGLDAIQFKMASLFLVVDFCFDCLISHGYAGVSRWLVQVSPVLRSLVRLWLIGFMPRCAVQVSLCSCHIALQFAWDQGSSIIPCF